MQRKIILAAAIALVGAASSEAQAGADLYVTDIGRGTIGEYNASTGAAINASLVSGLNSPVFLAVTNPPASVPEPASLSLLAAGALGLAAIRRRVRR